MHLVINDVHVGFNRKGGTTPKTRETLRNYLLSNLVALIESQNPEVLTVAGDLFDDFEIDPRDWVETYTILSNYLSQGNRTLHLIAGNHDHSPRMNKVSSFEMLANVLVSQFAGSSSKVAVVPINEIAELGHTNLLAIAHCANQDVFDARLNEALGRLQDGGMVILHANYENKFAVESDHSLNVPRELAKEFAAKNITLVFAHEHQARADLGGKVVVMGNQWPTSVADCIGNKRKYAHTIDIDGMNVTLGERVLTWDQDDIHGFAELDWRELTDSNADFIRIKGTATANEASDVITNIARFRGLSPAFVITNAVQVAGVLEVGTLPSTFEAAKAFDVMEFLAQHLESEEMTVVRSLAED